METNNKDRNQNQNAESRNNAANQDQSRNAPSRNQEQIDAARGDNDDFTTNGLDEGNTMGNDDNPADARESGTR